MSEQKKPFCPRCQKLGELQRLRERIYLDDKGKLKVGPLPPDHDNWLMCWKCGLVIPITSAKWQGQIKGIQGITPLENPHDFNKKKIVGIEDNRIKSRYQRLKKRQSKHPDQEVQKLIDEGWTVTSYSSSMPT